MVLIPSQKIVFLGYVIDSVEMTVSLPEEKANKLKEQTLALSERPQCSSRELAHLIGFIVSSFPAIKPARLYYRDLEVCKLFGKLSRLLFNGPSWGVCYDNDMCDDSEALNGEPLALW